MSENTITDVKTARALVKFERDRSKVVYADYITANAVTVETVGAHVKALQDLAFPKFDAATATDEEKYARKSFGNRIRNGLNHTLGKRTPSQRDETADASTEATEEPAPENDVPADAIVVSVPAAFDALEAAVKGAHAAEMSLSAVLALVHEVYGATQAAA